MHPVLLRGVIYPLYELATGRRILAKLRAVERSQWLSPEELAQLQTKRLSALLGHAYSTVPYYRQLFDAEGISPSDIRSLHDLPLLPVLTKSIIRDRSAELLSSAYKPGQRIPNHTGGSTGKPLQFYQDHRQRDWGLASKLRSNRWAGWDFGKRVLKLWGHPRDLKAVTSVEGRIRGRLLSETTFDAFDFGQPEMAALSESIERAPPQIIEAYASVLSHFAAYVRECGITRLPSPDGIITSTDMLFPHQRELIEQVFASKVYNRYGSREVAVIAAECGEHRGLHISAESIIVEITDKEGHALPPGRTGRVVITDLWNYAMPFIRYDIEDMASLGAATCPCGRGLPLMDELTGRYADVLRSPDGRYVSASALTTVLHLVPGLHQAQIVQNTISSLDVHVVQGNGYTAVSEETFRTCLAGFFGPHTQVTFHYVDHIAKTASGKTRFSVSRVGDTS